MKYVVAEFLFTNTKHKIFSLKIAYIVRQIDKKIGLDKVYLQDVSHLKQNFSISNLILPMKHVYSECKKHTRRFAKGKN